MKIALGSDHAGYEAKEMLKAFLTDKGIVFEDYGTNSPESTDYPDIAVAVSNAVVNGKFDRGILVCGTGIGMSIVANKIPGIRCAFCGDLFSARASREHNDSNVLAMGARVIDSDLIKKIVEVWLETEFLGGRHAVRVGKISDVESKYLCK